jgi:hypothetical protein
MDPELSEAAQQPEATTWSQDRRFQFIDYRLRWEGRLRRTDLVGFFNISLPQASADLAKYEAAAPENLRYDLSQKCYVRGADFNALYARSSAQMYLSELLALSTGILEPRATFLGWTPPVGIAPAPIRSFDEQILVVLVSSIREQRAVAIEYQSMNSTAPSTREISPTAMAYDGMRWHVRAYCHEKRRFQDFVVGRVLRAASTEKTEWTAEKDDLWNNQVVLQIGANPGLSEAARRAVELEYGMQNGCLKLEVRQALLYYTIRRLRLEEADESESPRARQLVLLNRADLAPFMQSVTSSEKQANGS